MGAASSSIVRSEPFAGKLCGLEDVPENCITAMFMYMEPPEICLLARVNKSFHRASRSDAVWEDKLPSNYKFLVRRILEDQQQVGVKDKLIYRKKEIYARLCRPNLFDTGTKVLYFPSFFLSNNINLCFFFVFLCLETFDYLMANYVHLRFFFGVLKYFPSEWLLKIYYLEYFLSICLIYPIISFYDQ